MDYFTSETLEAFLIKDPNKIPLSEKGKKLLRNSHIYNIDKWGKDESHNILYITGYSGSGKSTLATYFKDSNTDLIHLDLYFENNEIHNEFQNTNFNEYLKFKGIKPINMVSKDQWAKTQVFSKFEKAIEDFSKEQFHKGRKVIAEGIQIYDESLWEDKSHYKDKPLIIVKTNAITSVNRAMNRDGNKFKSVKDVKEYIGWYNSANKQIKNLDKNVSVTESTKLQTQDLQDKFSDVKYIVDQLSKKELYYICGGTFKNSPFVIYRDIKYINNEPAGFIDVYTLSKNTADIVFAVSPKYRNQGIIKELVTKMLNTFKSDNRLKKFKLIWTTDIDNEKSINLAKKFNLKIESKDDKEIRWVVPI